LQKKRGFIIMSSISLPLKFGIAVVSVVALMGIGWLIGDPKESKSPNKQRKKKMQEVDEEDDFDESMVLPKDPPKGFEWYVNKHLKCGVAVPKSWIAKENEAMFSIYDNKDTKTGITVTCMPKRDPQFLATLMSQFKLGVSQNGIITVDWEKKPLNETFTSYSLTHESRTNEGEVFVLSTFIYNEITGSIYLSIFETKKENWMESWNQYGVLMMQNMFFHPSI